jgi:hypothetical protein
MGQGGSLYKVAAFLLFYIGIVIACAVVVIVAVKAFRASD